MIGGMDCPCHSGMPYSSCCEPFHEGVETPPTAELLMRSRYSAYALGLADYIIATTHPRNPQYNPNRSEWIASIRNFSDEMEFVGLRILDADVQNSSATVTFEAQIFRGTENFSFREKSHFLLENCVWIYLSGDVQR